MSREYTVLYYLFSLMQKEYKVIFASHTSQHLLFQSVWNFCGRLVLNSQHLDTCQSLSNSQFEKLIFNMLSMRSHHVYCLKVIWTSLLFWLVIWASIAKRTQHLSHSELLGSKQLPSTGTRNNTGVPLHSEWTSMCQHQYGHIHLLDWNNMCAFPKCLSDWSLPSFPGLYAMSANWQQDRKSLPCFAYEQTPFFANVYVFQILSKQFPALNFLFTTAIPFQKKIYKSLKLENYVPPQLLINNWCNLKANKGFVSMPQVGH